MWTRTHVIGRFDAALSRMGASLALSRFTTRWHPMQVAVGGTFATGEASTDAWQ
jgi:hypothetical protein